MEKVPFVSVVVPVRNAERTLDKTFEYLLNIEYPRDRLEIVISDGGSSDGTIPLIQKWQGKYPFIKLVEVPNCPSPGFARNKALEVVKGEFIFFTDGDCAPCKEWITEMLSHFQRDPEIGVVGGEIYTLRVEPDNLTEAYCENFRFNMVSPRYSFIKEGYFPPLSDMSPSQVAGHRCYFFVTANVAYRKVAIEKSKARFWNFPTGEDIDFCLRIQKDGWKLYFAPKAKVDHMHRTTFKALRRVWVTYGEAHLPLIKEHSCRTMEVIFQFLKNKPRLKIPFPVKGFIYFGNFHLMHIFGLLFILGLVMSLIYPAGGGWKIFTVISFCLGLYFTYRFFLQCFYMVPRKHFFTWCKMKYLTNLSFMMGGLKGIRKYKVLCIEPGF
jgi:cellulose synthase/poly-beta-1,6-N-acetylglucosamine synthase-like glycosyltransferase